MAEITLALVSGSSWERGGSTDGMVKNCPRVGSEIVPPKVRTDCLCISEYHLLVPFGLNFSVESALKADIALRSVLVSGVSSAPCS